MFAALQRDKAGISLVELVVAVALLSLVSLAAVQLLNMTERTMVGSQANMNQQLRSESIASFIYKDFSRGELSDSVVSRTYTNASMPEDLQGGAGVTVVALYGKSTRFNGVDPLCALQQAADPAAGTFRMRADCMSRGGLPLFRDDKYRFFRLVHQTGEGGEQNAINYDTAVSTASSREDACGMQSYLATIVTEEEHDHLEKTMMIRETPGWQSGYIGGRVTEYDTFRWVTGPAAERSAFWFGLGTNGLPYLATNKERGDVAGRRFFEFDPKPNFGGNRRRLLVQPTRNNQSFLFTNWAGGKEYSAEDPEDYYCDTDDPNVPASWCQPASAMPGDGVAIYGHKNRAGTWFSVPSEAQKCDATQEHSICGFYVELVEPETERDPIRFAHQVTLDMDQFRDFCQMADQPSG